MLISSPTQIANDFNISWFISLGSEDNQLPMKPAKPSYAGQMKAREHEVCKPSITCLFTQTATASFSDVATF
jgi:hypothetical protein